MIIHQNFDGGNIKVVKQEGNTVYLENELRDTVGDWFYWSFGVEGAQGQTLTFKFQHYRLGYYGPAVSYDLENWHWLGEKNDDESFTYTFGENESKVYFAHDMYYHPDRFARFAASKGIEIKELCKTKKGRSVPLVTFGDGEEIIRPSQLSEAGVYGKAVYLNKVTRTESGFEEQKVREITTETLPIDIKETVLGIHTYSSSSKYEIIDVKYEFFNIKKIYIRIKRYLKKFLKKG